MKLVVAILLGMMFLGGVALVHWGPVRGYSVSCKKQFEIICILERESTNGVQRRQISLDREASATVRISPVRRGPARVFLYLESPPTEVFAAEFEGNDASSAAHAAAVQLNQVFSSTRPAAAYIEIRPPGYLRWMSWGVLAFMGLLILAAYRELLVREQPAGKP